MLILICLILLIVGLLTVQLFSSRHNVNLLNKIPGKPTLPIFGHALMLIDTNEGVWKTMLQNMNEYYPTMRIWLLSTPVVFIRHPDDIQILSNSKTNINKADFFYSTISKYGNDGILLSGGAKWQERRKLMNQAFLRNSLRAATKSANKFAQLIVQKIQRCEDKSILNILPSTNKFALGVICDASMGYDLHTVGAEYAEEYMKALDGVMEILFYRVCRPYITDWLAKLLLIEKKLLHYKKIINNFSNRVIEERRNYHKANGINILSDYLFNNADSEVTKVNALDDFNFVDMLCVYEAKGLIDEKGMHEEFEVLVSAGYETTALACAFTLLLLAENEHEQNLARKEVVDVMNKCDGKLTILELQKLQYLDRCVKESLRLFPPAPVVGRRLEEDVKFGNYVIPRSTNVFMHFYSLHRDPNFWTEPEKFNPDRFLPEFLKNQHPYAYLPFSGGPRNCIGQKNAIAEVKVMVSHILYNFYLHPVDYTCNIQFDFNAVLKPSTNKLRVKFTKILQHN